MVNHCFIITMKEEGYKDQCATSSTSHCKLEDQHSAANRGNGSSRLNKEMQQEVFIERQFSNQSS